MTSKYTFKKKEHLCGEIRVNKLFTEGKAFIVFPLRVVYSSESKQDNVAAKVLVSVPKKRFKRAVKRNLLKRRMREAYRLNKEKLELLLTEKNYTLNVAFSYVANEELPFAQIEKKMLEAFVKIGDRLPQNLEPKQ